MSGSEEWQNVAVKTLVQLSGKTFRFGRRKLRFRPHSLSLRNYLKLSLPSPPLSVDYTPLASRTLADIYGNDQLGDCVIACIGHILGVLTANANQEVPLSLNQIIKLYSAIGGYVPGDPNTDNGAVPTDALNYIEKVGYEILPEHKIAGYLAVNSDDPVECRIAIWLFENLMYGVDLPDGWVNPMPSGSGFIWDYAGAPDPQNGHCFGGFGYNPSGIKIDTWGMIGTCTDQATKFYCSPGNQGELYTALSIDLVKRATLKAPSGFDWSQLVADFDAIGHGKIM